MVAARSAYFIRKAGMDGFRFGFQPTLKKVVADRRASLDEEDDVLKPTRLLIRKEFEKKSVLPLLCFPRDGDEVADTARLSVVLLDPGMQWDEAGDLRKKLSLWTQKRGGSNRLYPASLVWCVRKAGKDLRNKVENWLGIHGNRGGVTGITQAAGPPRIFFVAQAFTPGDQGPPPRF